MKAIRFHACGGPEVLRLEEVPVPEAQPGEVLIRVQAAGVNFLDAYQRMGYERLKIPNFSAARTRSARDLAPIFCMM
jgi:NADPH2:quinone reductase